MSWVSLGFPCRPVGKESACSIGDPGSILGWGEPLEKEWPTTPVSLPGKSHGQRSLVGCSPWGRKESSTTEWLTLTYMITSLAKEVGEERERIPSLFIVQYSLVYFLWDSVSPSKQRWPFIGGLCPCCWLHGSRFICSPCLFSSVVTAVVFINPLCLISGCLLF